MKMEDVSDIHIGALYDSPYVKPCRLNYTQNGKRKTWDLLRIHDSVAVVIFNVTRKVMIFVKQFRPAVYYANLEPNDCLGAEIDMKKYPPSLGLALETCAGIVDKDKPIIEIAQEKILEETGYQAPLNKIELIISYRSGTEVQGSLQTLYFCEVTDLMKANKGGAVEDEAIEVVEMTLPHIEEMILSREPHISPPHCLFGIMWFLHYKADIYRRVDTSCVHLKDANIDMAVSSSLGVEYENIQEC